MQPTPQLIPSRGRVLDLSEPIVMGIINATPDSFHLANRTEGSIEAALELAERMVQEGASILDIGGQSTRPGSVRISASEEIQRVQPVLQAIRKAFPEVWISVDTYHSEVVKAAFDWGADLINDVSAGSIDPAMFSTVGALGLPYVLMHMQGTPETMQVQPSYSHVTKEVFSFLQQKLITLRECGVNHVIIDFGFGFGKSPEHNWTLLREMESLQALNCPILLGVSRKKSIQIATQSSAENSLPGTIAAQMVGLQHGAKILRTHDVKPAVDCIRIYQAVKQKRAFH